MQRRTTKEEEEEEVVEEEKVKETWETRKGEMEKVKEKELEVKRGWKEIQRTHQSLL